MKITGWRVDGYGVLRDHQVHDLPAGISVLLGPNEAGKTTLLDFLRSVLFGFPDRRHSRPGHPPLVGGRHGGALELTGDDGRQWRLERHRDGAGPVLTCTNAHELTAELAAIPRATDDESLRRLLGGADAELFRTVFAFGLAELSSFRLLESEDVRDLVFSAGVLGAGRSATRAAKALAAQQALLVRPRQGDATANRLRRRLSELERDLRELRTEAEQYPERALALTRATRLARSARDEADRCRQRVLDLECLERCLPVWNERRAACAELDELGRPTGAASALLDRASDIRLLVQRRSGHEERVARRQALGKQLADLDRTISESLAGLDSTPPRGWTAHPAPELGASEDVEALARRSRELAAHLDSAAADLARPLGGALDVTVGGALDVTVGGALDVTVGATTGDLAPPARPLGLEASGSRTGEARQPAATRQSLGELRLLAGERDRLVAERTARAHDERLASLAAPRSRGAPVIGYAAAALALLAAVGAGAVAVAVAVAHRHLGTAVTAVLAGTAIALVILAVVALVVASSRRGPSQPTDLTPQRDEDERNLVDLDRIVEAVADLARSVGLPAAPSTAEIDVALARLDAVMAARQRIEQLRTLARTRSALVDAIVALEAAITRFDSRVAELTLGIYDAANGTGSTGPAVSLDELDRMDHELVEVERTELRRAKLEHSVRVCDAELTRALGAGAAAGRLRAELESGDASPWAQEREELTARIQRADAEQDKLLRAQHERERDLAELESSARLAELETARSACRTELEAALERYAVLGIARALLARTLALYERERQPAVVARAAALFATVTDGRYPRLLAHVDDEAGGDHGIEAVTASGARIDVADLSRGTAEQLYLCLRIALAESFAARAEALPLVLDDVLVNFDPTRRRAVARVVGEYARRHQVLVFTCHPDVAQMLATTVPDSRVVELDRTT